ncbi:ribonuclease VapC [Pseudaminobacter salicylatoxidans]|uniref:Ribonuclease VapC n=1 Tax=Pseudaminobacter salicylatoxidans TaxID=93369 RepID=A0A316C305_PSESE|nr:ribonuclease VapC [Pseudaminobacter salicylatoxidans]
MAAAGSWYVETSAIVAVLKNEPEREDFIDKIEQSSYCITSPVSAFEASIALTEMVGSCSAALSEVLRFLQIAKVTIGEIGEDLLPELALARDRYGKDSGHPARLNLGDCFSYAVAKQRDVSLLYKGDDFALTDLG